MFDCSEILFLTVHDPIACKSVCRQNTLHPPSFGISRLWHEYLLLFQYGSRGVGLELGFLHRASCGQIWDQNGTCVNTSWKVDLPAPWVQFLPSLRQELPDRRRQDVNQQAAE